MSFKTVCVLHIGDQQNFIEKLDKGASLHTSPILFERVVYQSNQNVTTVLYLTLKKYVEKKRDLIVLISLQFLEKLWCTSYKVNILKDLMLYSSPNILHVWMEGVTVDTMLTYSLELCQKHVPFGVISVQELSNNSQTMVGQILQNLYAIKPSLPTSDLALDDSDEESVTPPSSQTIIPKNLNNMERIKDDVKLFPMGVIHEHNFSVFFDKVSKQNWKVLCHFFDVDPADIVERGAKSSPTRTLLRYLHRARPNLTVNEFVDVLRYMNRHDVIQYINDDFM